MTSDRDSLVPEPSQRAEGAPCLPDSEGDVPRQPPPNFTVGDHLDWDSELVPVSLVVELPFILMMATSMVTVEWKGMGFSLLIGENDTEVFVNNFSDDRATCGYQGNEPESFEERDDVQAAALQLIRRQQRTTVYFKARCHKDVLNYEGGPRGRESRTYLESLCEAHIPVLNELIRRYRLLTYDYFAYEVSAWDVPVWHVRGGPTGHIAAPLFVYASLRGRPRIYPHLLRPGASDDERQESYPLELVKGPDLETAGQGIGVPGEDDLLDARNLMERGDYNGAVRRTTTAIETLVEHVLRVELRKTLDAPTVDAKLDASKTDFPGRLRQWKKLSGAVLSTQLERELDETRLLRHQIVHQGRRLSFDDRERAQRCVDTGRWIFNHIERDDARRDLREKRNTVRAIARPTLALRFPVEETAEGFVVKSFRSVFSPPASSPDG